MEYFANNYNLIRLITQLGTILLLLLHLSINVMNTEGVIKNGQSRDTGNIRYTRYRTKTIKTQKHNTEN